MRRESKFSFRVSQEERKAINNLAHYLKRSESDAVRFLILTFLNQMEKEASSIELMRVSSTKED